MTRRRRQLRLLAPAALLLVVILIAALIASAASGPSSSGGLAARREGAHSTYGTPPRPVAVRLRARRTGTLSAALEDAATAALGQGRVVLLGGLDSNDTSTAAITVLAPGSQGTSATDTGARLPEPQHDAQAAALGGAVYVFGGGQVESYDHILRYEPGSGRVSLVGHLPQPASDVAVTTLGNTAYIVGGYNGERALDTILAWRPGGNPTLVGRLPTGLRYAAVAAAGSKVIIAGGSTEATHQPRDPQLRPLHRKGHSDREPASPAHSRIRREHRRHGLCDRRTWRRAGLPDLGDPRDRPQQRQCAPRGRSDTTPVRRGHGHRGRPDRYRGWTERHRHTVLDLRAGARNRVAQGACSECAKRIVNEYGGARSTPSGLAR